MPSHYLNQCWNVVNRTLGNRIQWNFNQNTMIFIQENGFENAVCKMVAMLSKPQCLNVLIGMCWCESPASSNTSILISKRTWSIISLINTIKGRDCLEDSASISSPIDYLKYCLTTEEILSKQGRWESKLRYLSHLGVYQWINAEINRYKTYSITYWGLNKMVNIFKTIFPNPLL